LWSIGYKNHTGNFWRILAFLPAR